MKVKNLVRQLSFGLLGTGVDLVLAGVALELNLFAAGRKLNDPLTILADSYKLTIIFKRQFLLKTSYYARKKGWLERKKDKLVLTKTGRKYWQGKLPQYQQFRPWSGRLYLVTYDINETRHRRRDQLRRWLIDHDAKMIQQSVWLSVTDLSSGLKIFQKDLGDAGTILVSSLKKGEGVGREKLTLLIERLYHLDNLNRRYFEFVELAKNKQLTQTEKEIIKFKFLAVLADDPQLPRGLLPLSWYGDYAYELYTKLVRGRAEI